MARKACFYRAVELPERCNVTPWPVLDRRYFYHRGLGTTAATCSAHVMFPAQARLGLGIHWEIMTDGRARVVAVGNGCHGFNILKHKPCTVYVQYPLMP